MSEYSFLLMKASVLLSEAVRDKEIKCYNKSVSALWFAIENILKAILLRKKGSYPRKVGVMIARIAELIDSVHGGKIIVRYVRELYNDRKNVDHSVILMSESRCEEDFRKGRFVVNFLVKLFGIEFDLHIFDSSSSK